MRKYMLMIAMAALVAGSAFAQEGESKPDCSKGKAWNREDGGQDRWSQMDKRGERPHGPMDPEMMEQMRANHKAIKELGDAARAETDPAKKAEIVSQLRAKLGEVADLMQKKREERLTQAEGRLAELKAKIEDSKTNRDKLIEEQVERVLAGERPMRPEAFDRFPNAKGGMPGHGPDCGRMPPPPEDMPEDMPPPPAE